MHPSLKPRAKDGASAVCGLCDPLEVGHHASQEFIKTIAEQFRNGYGFIPFLGAGFSVSAGIPIIRQLTDYLRRCICVALGAEPASAGRDAPQLWNPRTDRWPPLIDRERPEPRKPKDWLSLVHDKYQRMSEGNGNGLTPPQIYLEGYGAMAEWRTSLYFLSRLTLEPGRRRQSDASRSTKEHPRLFLGVPNQEVVDACFREVMRHKHPSLNHTMLAALSSLLRIDLILTTNFDNLVERAFEASRDPLQVFDVHLDDRLPEFAVLSNLRSIIKLHGSQRSLRADYSLDGTPSEEDRQAFAHYLAGRKLPPEPTDARTRNHLLMLGVGARERRTLAFVSHALKTLNDLCIFWVCYSDDEVKQVQQLAGSNRSRFHILRHTNAGLLLLHLYQFIRKTLPPSNTLFASATRLAIPPLARRGDAVFADTGYQDFREELQALIAPPDHAHGRALVVATSLSEHYGVASACAELFRKSEAEKICLWIEMNDIHSADDLFEAFQEAAYFNLGQADWTPLYTTRDLRPRKLEIERIANASSKPWLVFIDAREVPGSNREDVNSPNGWIDLVPASSTQSSEKGSPHGTPPGDMDSFIKVLNDLAAEPRNRVQVVLLCTYDRSPIVIRLGSLETAVVRLRRTSLGDSGDGIVNKILAWTAEEKSQQAARRRFLLLLVLMQRPRHFAIVWARGSNCDGEVFSGWDEHKEKWLGALEDRGLLRWKDGGYIWFHAGFRQKLRRCLALTQEKLDNPSEAIKSAHVTLDKESIAILRQWDACAQRADIQLNLATWYRKVFDSTGVSPAIFEIVDHLCFSVESLLRFAPKGMQRSDQIAMATERLDAARQLLREQQFLIQTQGHPRASLRRLDCIRDFLVCAREPYTESAASLSTANSPSIRTSIAKLQCVTTEIARAISREIGEVSEAYKRQREVGIRMLCDAPLSQDDVSRKIKDKSQGGISESILVALAKQYHESERSDGSQKQDRRDELIRWWRWCGMLGSASRSFDEAGRSLWRALEVARSGQPEYCEPPNKNPLLGYRLTNWHFGEVKGASYRFHLETLHAIELAASLLLLEAHTLSRLTALLAYERGRDKDAERPGSRTRELLQKAEEFAIHGLTFVEGLLSSGLPHEDHDFGLMWCKSRLYMVLGAASLHNAERKYRTRHAMSFMGDAAACLAATTPNRGPADLALIELRRADIRLQEAACLPINDRGEPFETWTYNRLLQSPLSRSHLDILKHLKRIASDPSKSGDDLRLTLRKIDARATDAIRFLDRAEPILRERRRNVWWTTWYFERRMRAISFLLWTSVVEEKTPIPFLGLEAAMRLTDTEPDNLLNDAIRMIHVDFYRLAMVVLGYASCARAFQCRLRLDPTTVELPGRLNRMRVLLDGATRHLVEVKQRRDRASTKLDEDPCGRNGADKDASRVMDLVLTRAEFVIASLAADSSAATRGSEGL